MKKFTVFILIAIFIVALCSCGKEPALYSVVFVKYDDSIITSQIVKEGDAATAPAARGRIGYTFSGWDTDFSNVTSDLTVKAQYKIITYTVTFVDDNGKIIKTQKVPYGSSATAPEPPIKEGLVFYGWNKEFDHVTEYITVTAIYQSPFIFILNEDEQSYSVKKNNNVQLIGNFVIPATYNDLPVTSIRDEAFLSCSRLESITIPDSVTSIGMRAFSGCDSLTSITIPDSVTSIGQQAFSGCHSLTSMTIPDSVTFIDTWAFANCYSLSSITMPNSVTFIGNWVFSACGSLESITYQGTKAQWEAIGKRWEWDFNTPNYVIHCTDGDIEKGYIEK